MNYVYAVYKEGAFGKKELLALHRTDLGATIRVKEIATIEFDIDPNEWGLYWDTPWRWGYSELWWEKEIVFD